MNRPTLRDMAAQHRPGGWRRFRSLPGWAQALGWLVLLMLVFSLLGIAMAEPPPSERTAVGWAAP